MKTLVAAFALFCGFTAGKAQGTAPAELKAEMKKLSVLTGQWKGEVRIRQRDGSLATLHQEEVIQFKLDSTVLLIEGTGRNPSDQRISFAAMAVISYNTATKEFQMKSHVLDGKQTEAYFTRVSAYHFVWGFDTPQQAKIRYDLLLNPVDNSWKEKGEYSPDGNQWFAFIEMTLTKQ